MGTHWRVHSCPHVSTSRMPKSQVLGCHHPTHLPMAGWNSWPGQGMCWSSQGVEGKRVSQAQLFLHCSSELRCSFPLLCSQPVLEAASRRWTMVL